MQEGQLNYVQRSILQWQLYKVQFNKGQLYNGNSTKVNLQRLTLQRSTLQGSGLDGGRRVPGTFSTKVWRYIMHSYRGFSSGTNLECWTRTLKAIDLYLCDVIMLESPLRIGSLTLS